MARVSDSSIELTNESETVMKGYSLPLAHIRSRIVRQQLSNGKDTQLSIMCYLYTGIYLCIMIVVESEYEMKCCCLTALYYTRLMSYTDDKNELIL